MDDGVGDQLGHAQLGVVDRVLVDRPLPQHARDELAGLPCRGGVARQLHRRAGLVGGRGHREDRDVVLGVLGLHQVAEPRAELARVAAPGGELGDAVAEQVDAGEEVLLAALDEPVAVGEHGHPVLQGDGAAAATRSCRPRGPGPVSLVEHGRASRGADQQRRRVAGGGVGERGARGVDQPVEHGDHLVGDRQVGDEPVEPLEHHRRVGVDQGVGPGGRPDLAHHDGRGHALAHHVAEGQHDRSVVGVEHVVPVAADVHVDATGLVVRADVEAGQLGQRVRHQAALQLLGVGVLDLVGEAALDGLGHLRGERGEERLLLGAQHQLGAVGQHEAADADAVDQQGHRGQAASADPVACRSVRPGKCSSMSSGLTGRSARRVRTVRDQRDVVEPVERLPSARPAGSATRGRWRRSGARGRRPRSARCRRGRRPRRR